MLFNKKEKIPYEVRSLSFCLETSKNYKLKCAGEKIWRRKTWDLFLGKCSFLRFFSPRFYKGFLMVSEGGVNKKPINLQIHQKISPNTRKYRAEKTLYSNILHVMYEITQNLLLTVRFLGNSV